MPNLNLAADLLDFLRHGKQLDYEFEKCEAGRISLVPLGEHVLREVWIDPDHHTEAENDPHAGEEGYYPVPAVNLVANCEGYDPEFVLLWLPESRLYGTWDSDHWTLTVFPTATWSDIAADPLKYVNAQWEPNSVEGKEFTPWPQYPFKKGRPF